MTTREIDEAVKELRKEWGEPYVVCARCGSKRIREEDSKAGGKMDPGSVGINIATILTGIGGAFLFGIGGAPRKVYTCIDCGSRKCKMAMDRK